ncbi:hypothetical protein DFW101_3490 [Solidesulfovibrio carbinoliphilus subsp. oakridgensis]|uniref:Uncharacterized protein n=1 Tax=Solidesulfovibrio carbinoliphilus subsp. oakridgensis TaxID=694327 RepID=G7QC42_9BACT|nr:hypothetical protein DFW101_3490 [Solidesulfovibrio carbinoliphilus subsp. oakridgensis]
MPLKKIPVRLSVCIGQLMTRGPFLASRIAFVQSRHELPVFMLHALQSGSGFMIFPRG